MTPKLKKIIIVIVVLIVLFVVYAIFIKPDPTTAGLVNGRAAVTSGTQEDATVLASQISQALLRIEQISLDKSIFSDAIYLSLHDRSKPITDEPIGRPNPFAPLGDMSSIVKSTTRATSTDAMIATTTKTIATSTKNTTIPAGTASN